MSIKLAVVGSRSFNDWKKFSEHLDHWIEKNGKPEIIVSGGAKGADSLAEKYASEKSIPTEIYKPDYSTYGSKAPLIRNDKIVEACTHMLAFPSNQGSGTQYTISKAEKLKKLVEVIYID